MNEISLFKSMFDIVPFGVYIVDVGTYEIVYMNNYLKEQRKDYTGEICYKSLYLEDKPCLFCKIDRLVEHTSRRSNQETITFEHFNPVDDKWYQLQEKAISWPDGRVVKYSIAVDISEIKEAQNNLAYAHAQIALKNKELAKLSSTDNLTQLNNRLSIHQILDEWIRVAKKQNDSLALIVVDIDYFKEVNDRFGHQTGDEVLTDIAEILSSNIRITDSVGRWGGEEFLIICPGVDSHHAEKTAERLRDNIEKHVFGNDIRLTASFGIACMENDDTEKTFIKRADDALYLAKNNGRNRVEFKKKMMDCMIELI